MLAWAEMRQIASYVRERKTNGTNLTVHKTHFLFLKKKKTYLLFLFKKNRIKF